MSEPAASMDGAGLRAHPRIHWDRGALEGLRARRIVSLVPSLSEALFVLGLGERLVGVTQYCVHPAGAFAALPKLGGTKDADVHAITALEPDLVIANQEENTPRVVRALADRGIDVWVTYPRTVEEGVGLLEDLASLGASAAAMPEWVEPSRRALDAARTRQAASSAPRPRVFCPIWRDPWMTVGRDTYIHDLLELCGATNAFGAAQRHGGADPGVLDLGKKELDDKKEEGGRDRRYPIVDLEAVVAAAPEVVVLPDEPYAFGPADARELSALEIPAARNGRIHLIDGTLVSWYGPRIAEAIRVLAGFFANS